jgi:hypothetical protein
MAEPRAADDSIWQHAHGQQWVHWIADHVRPTASGGAARLLGLLLLPLIRRRVLVGVRTVCGRGRIEPAGSGSARRLLLPFDEPRDGMPGAQLADREPGDRRGNYAPVGRSVHRIGDGFAFGANTISTAPMSSGRVVWTE